MICVLGEKSNVFKLDPYKNHTTDYKSDEPSVSYVINTVLSLRGARGHMNTRYTSALQCQCEVLHVKVSWCSLSSTLFPRRHRSHQN